MSGFRPPWWGRSAHVQTVVGALAPAPRPAVQDETFELPDGDFLLLSWGDRPAPGAPLLVLLHGLEGDRESSYIRRMLAQAQARGLAAVVHHHRDCGPRRNRLPRSYHSGDTADLQRVLEALRARFPESPLWAVGYSLGANVLVKHLGEQGERSLLSRAAAVSPPLDLGACCDRLNRGLSRGYQRYLLDKLKAKAQQKLRDPALGPQLPFSARALRRARCFEDFDDLVTAPLHGFESARDYYSRSSGMRFLQGVARPLLVLHAADDPFMTEAVIPGPEALSAQVRYELQDKGGHVGFIEGGAPWAPRFWLERRVLDFLLEV